MLFAGDACSTMGGRLGPSPIYEDYGRGMESLADLSRRSFAHACLSQREPIMGTGRRAFEARWGT